MNETERLIFVDRQCACVSLMIQEAERTLDSTWAGRLYEMADDLLLVVGEAVKEGPIPTALVARMVMDDPDYEDLLAFDETMAAAKARHH